MVNYISDFIIQFVASFLKFLQYVQHNQNMTRFLIVQKLTIGDGEQYEVSVGEQAFQWI